MKIADVWQNLNFDRQRSIELISSIEIKEKQPINNKRTMVVNRKKMWVQFISKLIGHSMLFTQALSNKGRSEFST